MRLLGTAIIGTHTSFQFLSTQDAVSFGNIAFSVNPLGFNRVEPGTFGGQEARENAYTRACLFHCLVMVAEPSPNDLTFVPGGVIPDEDKSCDGKSLQVLAAGCQEIDGDRTDRTTIHETEQHLICLLRTS